MCVFFSFFNKKTDKVELEKRVLELEGQINTKRRVFSRFLKMDKDSAAGIELVRREQLM